MSLSKAPIQTCNPEPGDICSSSLSLMLKRVQIHRDPPMDMEDAAGPSVLPVSLSGPVAVETDPGWWASLVGACP